MVFLCWPRLPTETGRLQFFLPCLTSSLLERMFVTFSFGSSWGPVLLLKSLRNTATRAHSMLPSRPLCSGFWVNPSTSLSPGSCQRPVWCWKEAAFPSLLLVAKALSNGFLMDPTEMICFQHVLWNPLSTAPWKLSPIIILRTSDLKWFTGSMLFLGFGF